MDIAFVKSFAAIASATARVIATASMSGTRVILFSLTPIMYEGVSGVASISALTASSPCSVG
jgi:hypothetical protein